MFSLFRAFWLEENWIFCFVNDFIFNVVFWSCFRDTNKGSQIGLFQSTDCPGVVTGLELSYFFVKNVNWRENCDSIARVTLLHRSLSACTSLSEWKPAISSSTNDLFSSRNTDVIDQLWDGFPNMFNLLFIIYIIWM